MGRFVIYISLKSLIIKAPTSIKAFMPIEYEELKNLLEENFPESEIEVEDLAGDNDHYKAIIKSPAFEGKSRIQQHKMVQEVVKDKDIHALSIKTSAS